MLLGTKIVSVRKKRYIHKIKEGKEYSVMLNLNQKYHYELMVFKNIFPNSLKLSGSSKTPAAVSTPSIWISASKYHSSIKDIRIFLTRERFDSRSWAGKIHDGYLVQQESTH